MSVFPYARGELRVHVTMQAFSLFCDGDFTEDEARALAKALLDGIERSKALTAPEI